jgi:hypothetical protein
VDSFLVIGTGLDSLKQTVDVARGRGAPLLKNPRFDEVKHLIRDQSSGLAYADLRGISRLAQGIMGGGPLASLVPSGEEGARDLHNVLEILGALDFIWAETEFDGDQVRVLVYVGPKKEGLVGESPSEDQPARTVTVFSS